MVNYSLIISDVQNGNLDTSASLSSGSLHHKPIRVSSSTSSPPSSSSLQWIRRSSWFCYDIISSFKAMVLSLRGQTCCLCVCKTTWLTQSPPYLNSCMYTKPKSLEAKHCHFQFLGSHVEHTHTWKCLEELHTCPTNLITTVGQNM